VGRPLRIAVPDGTYHVTNRGLERREIVRDDGDRHRWHSLLGRVAEQRRWRVFAWALMGNHFHLFLQTPEADLSAGMHDLQSGYASAFNVRHERRGPLFESRFRAVLVESAAHDWELTRYVHLNPVRAGLAGRPEDYRWSSARFYLSPRGAPRWLAWEDVLVRHGRTLRAARRAYAEYLDEGLAKPPQSPLRGAVAGTLLGSEAFVERIRAWVQDRLPDRDVPAARELRSHIPVEAVERTVCRVFGVEAGRLGERRRRGNDARGAAIYLCRKLTGEPLAVLAERFGGVSQPAITFAATEFARRLADEPPLARAVRACELEVSGLKL